MAASEDIHDKYWQEYWKLKARYLPRAKSCQQIYEDLVEECLTNETRWLDAGCGHILLHHGDEHKTRRLVDTAKSVIGLDGDWNSIVMNRIIQDRTVGSLESLPFRDNSIDLITCNMVIEHVQNPARFVGEIARVLRPGGRAIIHTPNLLHWESLVAWFTPHKFHEFCCKMLDRRGSEDVFPVFYRANTLGRLRQLFGGAEMKLEKGGLSVDVPRRFPIPIFSRALLLLNILEVKLLAFPAFAKFRHNLLVVFRKPLLTA
jgi:SAM-dependent methyltransferase